MNRYRQRSVGILVWTRLPVKGFKAKTRIGREIEDQELANRLSVLMARTVISNLRMCDADIYIYHPGPRYPSSFVRKIFGETVKEGFAYDEMLNWLENTSRGLEILFSMGYEIAISMVSDCPQFGSHHINEMVRLLDQCPIVLAPAKDNGINAYGMKDIDPYCLDSANVISRTDDFNLLADLRDSLNHRSIRHEILGDPLPDIDQLEDVRILFHLLSSEGPDINSNGAIEVLKSFLSSNAKKFGIEPPHLIV